LIKSDYEAAFKEVDVIACPTSPTTAFKIGEKVDDPLQMYLSDVFTLNQNLAGICGLALPCGFDKQGLRSACSSTARLSAKKKSCRRRMRMSRHGVA